MYDTKKILRHRSRDELINIEHETDLMYGVGVLLFIAAYSIAYLRGFYGAALVMIALLAQLIMAEAIDNRRRTVLERVRRDSKK